MGEAHLLSTPATRPKLSWMSWSFRAGVASHKITPELLRWSRKMIEVAHLRKNEINAVKATGVNGNPFAPKHNESPDFIAYQRH